ncbi:MAG: PKD domain-containing protein, partial [Deltaproteobacteria bacterium]|nr:PKD domain-containing protein [Deltaproteobacteria bacterium]
HLKVTLVWSDYPSATGVSRNLVNDLDLKVTSPQGTIYKGNVFSGGWSVTGGTEDRLNNVENVYVQSPAAGTWTVEVTGFNVPYGPQPFALVVDGADTNRPPVATLIATPTAGDAPLTVDFDGSRSSDPDGDALTYTWNFDDGSPTVNDVAPTHTFGDVRTYNVTLTVDDGNGGTDTATQIITVTAPGNEPPVASISAVPISGPTPLTVDFDGSRSSDPDGDALTYMWNFDDGSTTVNDMAPTHTFSDVRTYNVTLTVDDGNGGTDTATQVITVTAPANTIHLDSLSVKTKAGRWLWSMNVTATVKDANGGPVAGATVWYSWSDSPGSVYGDCRTGQNGECSVVGFQFRGTCLTFTVEDVSHSTQTYDPGQDNVNDISACK